MRGNWSYRLAVAIALAVLAYLTWQAVAGPQPDDAIDRQHNQNHGTTHQHDGLGEGLRSEAMPVDARAQMIVAGAEARLDEGAGTVEYKQGSRLWKSNLGNTKLQSWGCGGRDCRLIVCKVRGGFMYMGGTMYDRETNTKRSAYDAVNNAICIHKTFKNYKNAEWHNAWSFNPENDRYYFAKRRSCHDAGGC
jgi:hypothetical protein